MGRKSGSAKTDGGRARDRPQARPPPDPPPDAATGASATSERYRQLLEKYHSLIEKYEHLSQMKVGVFQLGWWALRTSASALALVRDGRIELSNDRWHALDARSDGLGPWEPVAPDEEGTQTYATLREIALDEAREMLEVPGPQFRLRRYSRSGSDQVVEVRGEKIEAEHDLVALLVHDVTEQARAEAELRKAEEALHHRDRLQAIGEVASGVAHDLNNALNVMRLRLELIRRDRTGEGVRGEQLEAFARIVDDAAVRVARMHDLAGKRDATDSRPIDLRQIVSEAVGLTRPDLEHRAVSDGGQFHLVSKIPEGLAVLANPTELKHVFVNLLLNARDAMPEGGTIALEGRVEKGWAVVSVIDEGTGIPEENLQRIFESFFTTKGSRGTGLGLSMARGALARIGGSIQARNRALHGSEFVLRFPLAVSKPPPPAEKRKVSPIRGTLRILLVDDDADCLEVTRDVLQGEGLSVDIARDGGEALSKMQANAYDLLLCDVGMPEMSGWQVAQEARVQHPGLSIYMVTGWAGELASADSRRQVVEGVLAKPLDLEQVRDVIGRIASTREEGVASTAQEAR